MNATANHAVSFKFEIGQLVSLTVAQDTTNKQADHTLQMRVTAREVNLGRATYLVESIDGTNYMSYAIECNEVHGTDLFASQVFHYRDNEERVIIARNNCAFEIEPNQQEYKVGDKTTCQFGNPGDTSWDAATHGHQEVTILAMEISPFGARKYYLVQAANGYVGRAGVPLARRSGDDEYAFSIKGMLYCTCALKISERWSVDGIAHQLGFTL